LCDWLLVLGYLYRQATDKKLVILGYLKEGMKVHPKPLSDMWNKNRFYIVLSIVWLVVGLFIIVLLYNEWFDTIDRIKYDPFYSPEFDRPNPMKELVFWGIVLIYGSTEIALIYLVKKSKSY
jgi:hypothetical protein